MTEIHINTRDERGKKEKVSSAQSNGDVDEGINHEPKGSMISTEKQIRIAARLYEARDACRSIFGVKWRDKIEPYAKLLSGYSEKYAVSILDAAITLGKEVEANAKGFDAGPYVMKLMAAAVEMIEPSKD